MAVSVVAPITTRTSDVRTSWIARVVLGGFAVVAVISPPLRADAQSTPASYEAVAAADGLRVFVDTPGAPLVSSLFDGGLPVTQATANSLGESVGFASMPYPGDTVSTLPGLLAGVLGLPSLPSYPLVARSQAGTTPEAKAGAGPFRMEASSDGSGSAAEAVAGGDVGDMAVAGVGLIRASSSAGVEGDGTVRAQASSTVEAFGVPGVLRLGAVVSTASVEQRHGVEPDIQSSFEIDGASIAGLRFTVTRDGIVLPGQTTPVPSTAGAAPILDAAGITLRYLPEVRGDGQVESAGLSVELDLPPLQDVKPRAEIVLGRVAARTFAVDAPPVARQGGAASAPATPPAGPPAPRVSAGAVDSPTSSSTSGVAPSSSPVTTPRIASGVPTLTATQVAGNPVVVPQWAAYAFYLMLVVGGFVTLTGSTLFRKLGVKLLWTR